MPVGEWTPRIVVDDLELELGIATGQPSLLQPSRHLQVLRLEIGGEIDARRARGDAGLWLELRIADLL